MLPNFLHIGVAKAASTWMWTVYQDHPDICVPTTKVQNYSGRWTKPDNCNFFVADFHRGLEWYEKTYFSEWNGEKMVGEFSNSYMVDELALQRIAGALADVKLTMAVRNPIDVAFLQYATQKRSGRWAPGKTPFEGGLDIHAWQNFRAWFEPGYYHLHISRVLRYFPRESLLVLVYDDLEKDARGFVNQAFEFLGVSTDVELPSLGAVVGFPRPDELDTIEGDLEKGISSDMRDCLRRIFADQISRLSDFLGRDLSHWR